jgi:hypothetical protein
MHPAARALPKLVGFKEYHQATFVYDGSLHDFVTFALSEWRQRGWEVSRGDAEPGEAENGFVNPAGDRFGAFRASSSLCDQSKTLVWLVVARVA